MFCACSARTTAPPWWPVAPTTAMMFRVLPGMVISFEDADRLLREKERGEIDGAARGRRWRGRDGARGGCGGVRGVSLAGERIETERFPLEVEEADVAFDEG